MSYTDGLYTIKVSYIFSITLVLFSILYFIYYNGLFSFSNICWIIYSFIYSISWWVSLSYYYNIFFLYIVFFFLLYFFLLYYIFLFYFFSYIITMISIIFISIIILNISIIFSIRNLLVWLILGCEKNPQYGL